MGRPERVAVDGSDNIYIADRGNHRVRKVDAATGIITTIAGNGTPGCGGDGGPATSAAATAPTSVALDNSGNVFFGDCRNIRRIDASTGIITTVAGNGTAVYSGDGGPATNAGLGDSRQILLDGLGNLFIADAFLNRIRRVDAFSGLIMTIAGSGSSMFGSGSLSGDGGLATSATLNSPFGVALDASGNLLIADSADNRIRKVSLPPFVGFQPYAVSFPSQVLGISSTQTITLESTGTAALSISSLSITGADANDFAISGSTCGTTLGSGKTCTVSVTFTPTVLGAESAALNVPTDAISSPQTVGLTGTSIEPTSTTTVTSSANPSVLNQAVTLTATVSSSAGGTPTGTVTFKDGSATLGTVALDGTGQATFTTSALGVGTHAIRGQYSGDANFTASIGNVSQEVGYGICALYDQTRSVNGGAVFPIKVELCDASGNDLSSGAIVMHATAIDMVSGYVGVPESPGNANPDSDFRYDSTLGTSGGYIFNLSTSGLAAGTYSLQFTAAGDPVMHTVNFGVK
jgi:hypothetical protein